MRDIRTASYRSLRGRRASCPGPAAIRLAATVLALAVAAAPPVLAGPQEEIIRRDYAISGFKAPPRWELEPRDRPTYPQLLATATRGQDADRATMTLVGKRLAPGVTLGKFAEEGQLLDQVPRLRGIRRQLQRQSGWFSGQRVQLDATIEPDPSADRKKRGRQSSEKAKVVRQLFFVNPPFGYVLTLVAPVDQAAARYRDLDDTASNLSPLTVVQLPSITPPSLPPNPAPTPPPVPSPAAAPPSPSPASTPVPAPTLPPPPTRPPAARPAYPPLRLGTASGS